MACGQMFVGSKSRNIMILDEKLPYPPVEPVDNGSTAIMTGVCGYYHYNCDLTQDAGWGCGYRTLQTICSWIASARIASRELSTAPTIPNIQQTLVDIEDKPPQFLNSKEWIGSFEALLVIDKLFDVPCKILHVATGADLCKKVPEIVAHFKSFGSPIMMGGDEDCGSKGIFGIHTALEKTYLLVVDPHYKEDPVTVQLLVASGHLAWKSLEQFSVHSFYNLCLPQYTHPFLALVTRIS